MTPAQTKTERFSAIPWGTIIALVNVIAGVVFAVGMGLATVAQQLPDSMEKYGALLSTAGLVASALAGGLYAIGKGLHNIGDGRFAQAANASLATPSTININNASPNANDSKQTIVGGQTQDSDPNGA